MLSGPVLKQFRTYLKSQVGNGWSVEGRKSKGRLLTRVSFRYLSGEISVVLLAIDFDREWGEDAFHQWSPEKIDFYLEEGTK